MRQALQDGIGPGVISQAVLGLGGVGKSEPALQYAYRHRGQYRVVWWIYADSPDLIRAGLAAFAGALTCGIDSVAAEQTTVEEAAARALSWLAVYPGRLVIFDNVEEAGASLFGWIACRRHLIIAQELSRHMPSSTRINASLPLILERFLLDP
ncbi:hypothetical protein [Nonomuraea sp. NPDC049480]|uniref:hypothetical protein n=1 Tax=Nonomuraea sp. NPDC049480 TaxID=3364353 RepID=UPI0037A4D7DE